MQRSGSADMPLHGGRVPRWLAERMEKLSRAITQVVVEEYGTKGFLTRISDPFWFQCFGATLGMDWHSSGITTSVMGALKRSLNPLAGELGIYICGGRGKQSRRTPTELLGIAGQTGLDGNHLINTSKLVAKVDNTLLQDGYQLYLHSFIVTKAGEWAVVQQGMNDANGMARRYHWLSSRVNSFVLDPHAAVEGRNQGQLLNLSDGRAEPAQQSIIDFIGHHPDKQLTEMRHLVMDSQHAVLARHVNSKRLAATLLLAHEKKYQDFTPFLLQSGVGPRTVQSLALVSELIYGKPTRFDDPARFSFAHGGKDGHPFPVLTATYDESIGFIQEALGRSRVSSADKLSGFKSLHKFSQYIEDTKNPSVNPEEIIRWEKQNAWKYGGRTVYGIEKASQKKSEQLSLF